MTVQDPGDDTLRAEHAAMLARIGHELRGPLHALCAALDVLALRPPPDADAAEALAVATRQARQLVERIDTHLPRLGHTRGS